MARFLFILVVFSSILQCKTKSSAVDRRENMQEESRIIDSNDQEESATINHAIINKQWQAIEIMGDKLDESFEGSILLFLNENGEIKANGDCNFITGTYQVKGKNQIIFSNIVMTKRGCDQDRYDGQLYKALNMTRQFIIEDGELMLIVGKRAALARFKLAE